MMRRGLYLSLFAVSLNVYAADISSSLPANIVLFGNTSLSTGTGASGLGIPRFTISNDSNILATQSGSWTTGRTWTLGSGTDLVSAVQSGSWTVTANAGTNLNTSALALSATQTNGNQKTQIVDGLGSVVGPVMTASGVNYLPVAQPVDISSSIINVTTQDLASTTTLGFANQQLITGTPTTNSAASYSVNSIQTVMVLIGGTWTGTLSIEVSEDGGTTWEPRSIHVIGTSTFSASITGNVAGSMNAAGKTNVRVRATTAMTGTAVIKILTSDNPSNVYVANSIKLVDGSTTPNVNTLTIKSASTQAVAADTSAVVTLSPNSPTPPFQDRSGTGTIIALNGAVTATTTGASTVYFNITGTWVATLLFEGQDGNGNWQGVLGTVVGNGSPTAATGTNLAIAVPCGGFNQVRVRANPYTSGTATVNYNVGAGLNTMQVFNLTPSGLQAMVTGSGSAGTPASGVVSVQGISGGTNIPVTSKSPLTANSPFTISVGVTTGTFLASNSNRKGMCAVNTSNATVSFAIGTSAVLNSGITLYPGGTWCMDEYSLATGAINAIANAAASAVAGQEFQ